VSVAVSWIVNTGEEVGLTCTVREQVRDGDNVKLGVNPRVGVSDADGAMVGVLVGGPEFISPGEGITDSFQSPAVSVSIPTGYRAR
jgi:hypothetical protein